MQLALIGFAEVEMLCTGKDQTPISIRHWQVNVEAMRGRHDVRNGSHRGLCCRCVDDHLDLVITQGETLFDAESVLDGWRDRHNDAFNDLVFSGLDVAGARTMRASIVIGPQTIVVQKCMFWLKIGVQRDAMCAQIIAEVINVDVAAVSEIHHVTKKYSSKSRVAQELVAKRLCHTRLRALE